MLETILKHEQQAYEQRQLRVLLRWGLFIDTVIFIVSCIGAVQHHLLTDELGIVIDGTICLITLFAQYLLRRKQQRLAASLYLFASFCFMSFVVWITPLELMITGGIGFGIYALLATYLEAPRRALGWAWFAGILYMATLYAKRWAPPYGGNPADMYLFYLLPPFQFWLINRLGIGTTQRLLQALRVSEEARFASDEAHRLVSQQVEEQTLELRITLQEREAARLEAEEARQQAEAANQAKSIFLSTMSHELRSPLNIINNFSILALKKLTAKRFIQALEKQGINVAVIGQPGGKAAYPRCVQRTRRVVQHRPTQRRQRLTGWRPVNTTLLLHAFEAWAAELRDWNTRVKNNGDNLLSLINDILDLSKVEAGKMLFQLEDVDVPQFLASIPDYAAGLLNEKPVDFRLDLEPDLPAIRVDRHRFRQIVLNLVSNAAKFTKAGSITVRAFRTPDDKVRINIIDTGIGIAPDDQEHVFIEFKQIDNELSRQYQGTGLGLPIAKKMTEEMHGQIGLDSVVGTGSTFWITFPIAPVHAPMALLEPDLAAQTEHHSVMQHFNNLPVVVVIDDDADTQRLMELQLKEGGFNVVSILESHQAIAQIEELQPHIVLLDVLMPGLGGWDILIGLKANPMTSHIPVVMASMVEEHAIGAALGASAYLVKPIDEALLLGTLRPLVPAQPRILIVDDDEDARHLTATMLADAGIATTEAASGDQALVLMRASRPQAIILDLMMPTIDGFAILSIMQSDPELASIPVLVVSAKTLTTEESQRIQQQAHAYIQKHHLTGAALITFLHAILSPNPFYQAVGKTP